MNESDKKIIERVNQLLIQGSPQAAIALIRKHLLVEKKSSFKICPRCGVQRMRSDNTKGICSICQQQDRPSSKYRRKE